MLNVFKLYALLERLRKRTEFEKLLEDEKEKRRKQREEERKRREAEDRKRKEEEDKRREEEEVRNNAVEFNGCNTHYHELVTYDLCNICQVAQLNIHPEHLLSTVINYLQSERRKRLQDKVDEEARRRRLEEEEGNLLQIDFVLKINMLP